MKQRLLTLLLIFLSTISVAWAQRNRRLTLEAIEDGTITFSYVISKDMLCFVNGTKYPIAQFRLPARWRKPCTGRSVRNGVLYKVRSRTQQGVDSNRYYHYRVHSRFGRSVL